MGWEALERGAKIVGTVAILVSLIVWIAGRASASDVHAVQGDVKVLQEQRKGEVEWRLYLVQRFDQIAAHVGAPAAPPPPPIAVSAPDGGAAR